MRRSHALFRQALKRIPGGVNSPVRAFLAVGGEPVFFRHGNGAHLYDEDEQRYVDFVGSWGPMIVGHAHPDIVKAVQEAVSRGLGFGTPTAIETTMAEKITGAMPAIEKIRMVNSGTEATMSAIRLARGFTGRDKIVKFEGCYHGHVDSLLVKAGSGALTHGEPTSPGVPKALAEHTITLTYNDISQVDKVFNEIGESIAAIIVEPVAGNMGCVLPVDGFLEGLRCVCDAYDSVLIFDEVMTGFRVAYGGAQGLYNVLPDLTTLGKIIGGGLPVGAFGGCVKIMDHISPVGPVYQAGTLSGNPIAMTAGLATLDLVSRPGFYEALSNTTEKLTNGIQKEADAVGIPLATNQIGGMFGIFFSKTKKVTCFKDVMACDQERFKHFFHGMLAEGIYLAPSAYETGFVSSAHDNTDIDATLAAARKVFKSL